MSRRRLAKRTFAGLPPAERSRRLAARSMRAGRIYRAARPGYYVTRAATGALTMLPETKYFDSTYAATAFPSSADWTGTETDPATQLTLFSPGPGSAINQRIGRKCFVKAIRIHGLISFTKATAQTTVSSFPDMRILLVQDLQSNGLQAQGEQVLAAPATAAVANALCSFQSLANLGKFRVLKDKRFSIRGGVAANNSGATTISTDFAGIQFKWNVIFKKPVVVHFNATGGTTFADVVDNSWHLIANSTADVCTLTYECRVTYTDY